MKKVGDLFAELGFRPDASDGAKKAFIENLIRSANADKRGVSKNPRLNEQLEFSRELAQEVPSANAPIAIKPDVPKTPQQLSFVFDLEETKRSG